MSGLASLDTLEYERERDSAAAGLGIRVSALDKLVKCWRAVTENEKAALPHWNVEPSAEPVDSATLLNSLRQVFRRHIILPKGVDTAMGAACMDHGRRGRLAAFGAGVADKALR